MKKRRLPAVLTALALILALAACGGSAGGESNASFSSSGDSAAPMEPEAEGGMDGAGFAGAQEEADSPAAEPEEGGDSAPRAAKLIYTGNLEVETTSFDECASGLESLVERLGGYMEHTSLNSYGGARYASYTVRVPSDRFQALLESVGRLGHVVYQDKDARNITKLYYDTQSRLTTQRTKLERLQTLLAQAENMEDIITIESAISDTELAIEDLAGSLWDYDDQVDYSTVYINLSEVYKLSNVEEVPAGFPQRLGASFRDGLSAFGGWLEDLAVWLAYHWLWLVVLAAAAFGACRVLRRVRRRRAPFPSKNAGSGPKGDSDSAPPRE